MAKTSKSTNKVFEDHSEGQKEPGKHFKGHIKKEGQNESLECEKCKKKFKNQKQLNVHKCRHLGIFSCRDCDERFPCLADLKKHEQKDHDEFKTEEAETAETKNFTCDICQKGFSQKNFLFSSSFNVAQKS